jgi:hypothetical protein
MIELPSQISEARAPLYLYHYTDFAAALNILRSTGVLWASEIKSLNDLKEGGHALEVMHAAIGSMRDLHSRNDWYKCPLAMSLQIESHDEYESGYTVVSLCEERDQLSLWRAYGNRGRGIAIGLDTVAITNIGKEQGLHLESAFMTEIFNPTYVPILSDVSFRD